MIIASPKKKLSINLINKWIAYMPGCLWPLKLKTAEFSLVSTQLY